MTVSASNNAIDLKALLYALTQQHEPLPEPFQRSLQEAGRALQQNQPDAAQHLRDRVESYSPLDTAYKNALQELDKQYASQQRTKSLGAALQSSVGTDWLFLNDIVPTTDWVSTAKQVVQTHQPRSAKSAFWVKADRVVITTLGGIALGAAIAQIPGAVIVGLSAAIFSWWYVNSPAQRSSQ